MDERSDCDVKGGGGPCQVCHVDSSFKCVKCHQTFYCSKDHQKQDWKEHKKNCFPIKIVSAKGIYGEFTYNDKFLEATRDIPQGEIILKENPIFIGPRLEELYMFDRAEKYPLCLECCRVLRNGQWMPCNKCKWPLCPTLACQNGQVHSNFECAIFAKHKVHPIEKCEMVHYGSICLLRALMLSKVAPAGYEQMMDIDGMEEIRRDRYGSFGVAFSEQIDFVRNVCGQTQYDVKIIDHLMGVMQVMRKSNERSGTDDPYGSYHYYRGSLMAHSCTPNSMWFVQHNNQLFLRASIPIKAGEPITSASCNMDLDTSERRKILWECFIDCKCKRCADPTEMSTFLSAVKCTKCTSGYFLLENPLIMNSHLNTWVCNNCGEKHSDREIRSIVEPINQEYESIKHEWESYPDPKPLDIHLKRVKKDIKLLKKYEGKVLHKNHSLLFRCKLHLGNFIPKLTPYIDDELHDAVYRNELEEQQVGWVQECLDLADVFWPGLSRYRGQLLYTLQRGMFCLIFTEVEKLAKGKKVRDYNNTRVRLLQEAFRKILDLRKKAQEILSIEAQGTAERGFADELASEGYDFKVVRNALHVFDP